MDYYYTVAEDMESNVDTYEAANTSKQEHWFTELNIPNHRFAHAS